MGLYANCPMETAGLGGVAPVPYRDGGGVLVGGGLVVDWQELAGVAGQHFQIHHGMCAESLDRGQLEVTVEVLGIES